MPRPYFFLKSQTELLLVLKSVGSVGANVEDGLFVWVRVALFHTCSLPLQ